MATVFALDPSRALAGRRVKHFNVFPATPGPVAKWLQQRPHKPKTVGSIPTGTTMKIDISKYYQDKGYATVYVVMHGKEHRRMAILRKENGDMTSMSYAKYLYTSHHQTDVAEGDHVDHINGDKLDDRIENLQVISGTYNRKKDHKRKEMVLLVCPVCGEEFLFPKGNLSTHPNPCCSRKCGGIKSHWRK